jgi:hypothetical protein
MKPLQESLETKPIISSDDIRTIFSNIETIYRFHSEFLEEIRNPIMNWTPFTRIGSLFSKLVNLKNR